MLSLGHLLVGKARFITKAATHQRIARNKMLQGKALCALHHLPDRIEVCRLKLPPHNRRAKLVIDSASDEVDTFHNRIGVNWPRGNLYVLLQWPLNIHCHEVEQLLIQHLAQHRRVGPIGIELDEETELLDSPNEVRQILTHRRLTTTDCDAIKQANPPRKKIKNLRLRDTANILLR